MKFDFLDWVEMYQQILKSVHYLSLGAIAPLLLLLFLNASVQFPFLGVFGGGGGELDL